MKKIFVPQKKFMRLLTFSDYCEDTSPIFKSLKVLKFQDIIKFSISKPIYFYFNDQLPFQVKNIFIKNESVNPDNARGGKGAETTCVEIATETKKCFRLKDMLNVNVL